VGCAVAGFIAAALIFVKPWHLPPNWGDIPTWLAFLAASAAGVAALVQLARQQTQIHEEAERNVQRDALAQTQLAEANIRAIARQREQAEQIHVSQVASPAGSTFIRVTNNSPRPIRDVTCKIMSRVDDGALALSTSYMRPDPVGARSMDNSVPGNRIPFIRPSWLARFIFQAVTTPDRLSVSWFADDADVRWQLDEDLHLVLADPDGMFVPIPESRLPRRT
jgi:hypothetical protein